MKRVTFEEASALLVANNQPNILRDYDELSLGHQINLLQQIGNVDWDAVKMVKNGVTEKKNGKLSPPDSIELKDLDKNREAFHNRGQSMLRAGKIGAVMLAGGVGTRLGAGKPKGQVNIGVSRNLYIYECLINNLLEVVKREDAVVPLYIMTNEKYKKDTEVFFRMHKYFGYPEDLVTFYVQDNNACVDFDGNLLMDSKGNLAMSPNGNGGWFESMAKADLLKDIKKRGVEWLNVFAVDNVLQRIADPLFIGAVALGGYDSGAKAVRKAAASENVGVFCLQDGKPSVVEYYEMDEELKNLRDEDGELVYRFGVTLNYLFNVQKLTELLDAKFPVHIAKKKIPCMTINGDFINPKEPNGYKFETLAADMVAMMDNCLCFEILRSREFAPIKNAKGVDSVETARRLLEQNGVRL